MTRLMPMQSDIYQSFIENEAEPTLRGNFLGFRDLIVYGLGGTIGAGIFVITGVAA